MVDTGVQRRTRSARRAPGGENVKWHDLNDLGTKLDRFEDAEAETLDRSRYFRSENLLPSPFPFPRPSPIDCDQRPFNKPAGW